MKFSKLSQLVLVSAIGLLVAISLTACQLVTIDYVFVADSAGSGLGSAGQIETFAVDSQSGALRTGAPTVSSGGIAPLALAVTADYANLYALNASGTLVHFTVATNGVLTAQGSVTVSGTPVSVAVNQAGTYLFLISQAAPVSQPTATVARTEGTLSATPGQAQLTVYPLSGGVIGTPAAPIALSIPGFSGDVVVPTGVTTLANDSTVYVAAYDQSAYNPGGTTTSTAHPGWVFGFNIATGGVLSAAANSPYQAGIKPSALAADPTGRFLYVTDFSSNQMIGYAIQAAGTLHFLINGPFGTATEPQSVVVDPRGKYVYVANSLASSVTAFSLDLTNGSPTGAVTGVSASGTSTDTDPVAIAVDPALGRFVYTADYLGNTASGFRIDPDTGSISYTQGTPYPTGYHPTSLVIVPHGNVALQTLTP